MEVKDNILSIELESFPKNENEAKATMFLGKRVGDHRVKIGKNLENDN